MNQKYITVDIPSSKKNYPLRIPDNGRVMVASTPEFHDLPIRRIWSGRPWIIPSELPESKRWSNQETRFASSVTM